MKKLLIYFLSFFIILSGCDSLELEETDPNNFKDATPDLLIKAPMLAQTLVIEGELARLAGIFSNQFTGSDRQYVSYNSYNIVSGDFDNIWGNVYADGVAQCRIIREKAVEINNDELEGIAMIIEANILGVAAALWGDVPNTEACDDVEFPQPSFDGQLTVYNAAIQLLNTAITKVGGAGGNSYGSDVIDASVRDNMLWTDVAYSIQARLYLHIGDYTNAIASANLGIADGDSDWLINHDDSDNWTDGIMNIYWNFMQWNRYGYLGADDAYLPQLLINNTDPRYDYYYYSGDPYDITPFAWYGGIFQNDHSFPVITYYETQLIIAESEMVDGTPDPAAALVALNNVRAYWDARLDDMWGDDDYFLPYLATDFATNADLLEAILTEKYISCYGQLESWNDMRRTDNYIGIPLKTGTTDYPRRFPIPQNEIDANVNASVIDIYVETPVNAGAYPGL
ncbi:MAG: hypothetical protein A2W99_02675 [Bacteroidetes bacterium GWF2_33_16]|nr:MAG: hypothetical protein A2X00_07920 [Bacteroidetes bacterium GWE2_32_14]OFY07371.1 MAG: hypothetical protein A2W99_02675 [Bacteroidetes bacterium GWF2_33_16]